MKTIKSLIDERLQFISIRKQIDRDERTSACYEAYPELSEIDAKLVDIHKAIMLAAIDRDSIRKADYETRKKLTLEQRTAFIDKNNIAPDFDEERCECEHCSDTGFIKTKRGNSKVCSCMRECLDECYKLSGMRDFASYSMKSLDKNMFGDADKRISRIASIVDPESIEAGGLWLYSDSVQSGKTYLTVCAVKALISLGYSAYYMRAEEVLDITDDEFNFAMNCDFLAIDDFSEDATSKFGSASAINKILESRIATGKKTMLVSSSPKDNLVMGCDVRIAGKVKKAKTL